jgi:hypothetical protein
MCMYWYEQVVAQAHEGNEPFNHVNYSHAIVSWCGARNIPTDLYDNQATREMFEIISEFEKRCQSHGHLFLKTVGLCLRAAAFYAEFIGAKVEVGFMGLLALPAAFLTTIDGHKVTVEVLSRFYLDRDVVLSAMKTKELIMGNPIPPCSIIHADQYLPAICTCVCKARLILSGALTVTSDELIDLIDSISESKEFCIKHFDFSDLVREIESCLYALLCFKLVG